jgi:hypothetical protein
MDAVRLEMDDFSRLDPWIAEFEALPVRHPSDLPPEVIRRVAPSITMALVLRKPDHPDLLQWFEKGMIIFKDVSEAGPAIRMFIPLALFYFLRGDVVALEHVINLFQWCADDTASFYSQLAFQSIRAFYCLYTDRHEECLRIDAAVLQMEKQLGITLIFPEIIGAIALLRSGKPDCARSRLRRLAPHAAGWNNWARGLYHTAAGWLAIVERAYPTAKTHALKGLVQGKRLGNLMLLPLLYLLCALAHGKNGHPQAAQAYLNKARKLSLRFNTHHILFGCHLLQAELAASHGRQKDLAPALASAFALGAEHNYLSTYFWRKEMMTQLCIEALKRDIEPAYARMLIRHHRLLPDHPPIHIKHWPWQIKIFTLGAFRLEIDSQPVNFNNKPPLKPLLLLKYLVAKGGRNIPVAPLRAGLWPDSDEIQAKNAFKAALRRLRELLKEQRALILESDRLSLNPKLCWTDLWEYEDICSKVESEIKKNASPRKLTHLRRSLDTFYQGPFLWNEDADWILSKRDALASRFVKITQYFSSIQ